MVTMLGGAPVDCRACGRDVTLVGVGRTVFDALHTPLRHICVDCERAESLRRAWEQPVLVGMD